MRIRVSVAPDRDACELPAQLYQRYRRAIEAGVKRDLYLLKGQEWYDPGLSGKFEKTFNQHCAAANTDRLLNFQRGPVTVRARTRIA